MTCRGKRSFGGKHSRQALIYRAHKICSNSLLLKTELQNIAQFASWNGYPRRLVNKLIESFTPKPTPDDNTKNQTPQKSGSICHLSVRENLLIFSCTTKITRLLKQCAQFITICDTTNTNTFLSMKDRTPKELQSSVVYKFTNT